METRTLRFQVLLIVGLIMVTLCSPDPLQALTNVKLSGVMPSFGSVIFFQISPDGRYAVYVADQTTDGVNELYSVLLGGGPPTRLNPPLPIGRNVSSFQISPDSSRVVYQANQDTATVFELYSVPIGGPAATAIKLNGALVAGGNVDLFQFSPDSSRVIYYADQQTANVFELYSVPLGGPAAAGIKLNVEVGVLGSIDGFFVISPDSSQVVYQAHQQNAVINDFELYSVPLNGPATAGIILNGAPFRQVLDFKINPDSTQLVYITDQDTVGVQELYSVPLAGPAAAAIKLNGPLVAGGNVHNYSISPDGSRVVYRANQDTAAVFELYSAPIGGPAAAGIKLNGTLGAGGSVNSTFLISPDSSRVVYQQTVNVFEIYSVPLGGPATAGIKLNKIPVLNAVLSDFKISPDSTQLVYIADQDTVGVQELYSVPLTGPSAAGIKLNRALVPPPPGNAFDLMVTLIGKVFEFRIAPDSSRVVYRANQDTPNVRDLYSVPTKGPASAGIKLNGPLVTGRNVSEYQISPDSGRTIYISDQDTVGVMELYMTSFSFLYLPLILNQG